MESKDLISIADLNRDDLTQILNRAAEMKMASASPLKGQTLAMIFEKPSLRTKVSFDVAMNELGGYAIYISGEEIGLGKREPISDVAQVLSRYVDLIMARTFEHSTVESLAQHATVPVINGLSNREHPCQAIADLLTIQENKGVLEGLTVAYIGDGNNVAVSLLLACAMAGTSFKFAAPKGYELPDEIIQTGQQIAAISKYQIVIDEDPQAVAEGADVIYTDVWTSMGQEAESEKRRRDFASYRITAELLAKAKPNALLMHPMPVHHGEEFAEGLIDCPQSVLFDQAENRLHAQKAILVELAKR